MFTVGLLFRKFTEMIILLLETLTIYYLFNWKMWENKILTVYSLRFLNSCCIFKRIRQLDSLPWNWNKRKNILITIKITRSKIHSKIFFYQISNANICEPHILGSFEFFLHTIEQRLGNQLTTDKKPIITRGLRIEKQ